MIIKDVRSESFCSKTFIRWYGTKEYKNICIKTRFWEEELKMLKEPGKWEI